MQNMHNISNNTEEESCSEETTSKTTETKAVFTEQGASASQVDGSSKIPGHDFQTWHDRRSQARKCTCRKLPGCENYRRNAHPGVVLVLIIRTGVSVLILFVPIWRPLFFLRASRHTLIVFENRNLFVYLVSSVPYLVTSAFIPLVCSELNSTSSSSLSSAVLGRAVNDHQCCQAVKPLKIGCDLCLYSASLTSCVSHVRFRV